MFAPIGKTAPTAPPTPADVPASTQSTSPFLASCCITLPPPIRAALKPIDVKGLESNGLPKK